MGHNIAPKTEKVNNIKLQNGNSDVKGKHFTANPAMDLGT